MREGPPAASGAFAPLAVLEAVPLAERASVSAIRWIDAAGGEARLALPPPGGVAVRRTALSAAPRRAREAGAEVVSGAPVVRHRREGEAIVAEGTGFEVAARVLVAADGLNSPTRRREGLASPPAARRATGCGGTTRRRHGPTRSRSTSATAPRPTSAGRAVAGRGRLPVRARRPAICGVCSSAFRRWARRVAGAAEVSAPRGAGPFDQASRARVADWLVPLGTRPGMWMLLPAKGSPSRSAAPPIPPRSCPKRSSAARARSRSAPTEAVWRRRFRLYAAWTRLLLAVAHRPALRPRLLSLARSPALAVREARRRCGRAMFGLAGERLLGPGWVSARPRNVAGPGPQEPYGDAGRRGGG